MSDPEPPATPTTPAELDDVMLAMDVVDTLRHQERLVEQELGQDARDEALKARLRRIYEGQGLQVTDRILEQGIVALRESRFTYTPPPPGLATSLARLWVRRRAVGRVVGIGALGVSAAGTWQVWQGQRASREAEVRRVELAETLPAALDDATRAARAAASDAGARAAVEAVVTDGEVARAAQDGAAMRDTIDRLDTLRADLLRTYTLTIVSREGEDTGVFRVPDVNQRTRNYYLIVEARTPEGEVLSMPIRNEETGRTETVSKWGVRVPQATFEAVRDDKMDDGIVQDAVLGEKGRGTLVVRYLMPVEDGAITEW